MSRISKIALIHQPCLYTLSIRRNINFMEEFSELAGYSFNKITAYLNSLNELPGGEPFVCFHNMDLDNLDVETGFPVVSPLIGKEDITAGEIKSQKTVWAIDLGPYENQDPTLEELFSWIQSNGYEMKGEIYYHYLNDTERSENELLTKMVIPLK